MERRVIWHRRYSRKRGMESQCMSTFGFIFSHYQYFLRLFCLRPSIVPPSSSLSAPLSSTYHHFTFSFSYLFDTFRTQRHLGYGRHNLLPSLRIYPFRQRLQPRRNASHPCCRFLIHPSRVLEGRLHPSARLHQTLPNHRSKSEDVSQGSIIPSMDHWCRTYKG